MPLPTLFEADQSRTQATVAAETVRGDAERLIADVGVLQSIHATLSAEDQAELATWFAALKTDLADRLP